jgi:hypothetical protein
MEVNDASFKYEDVYLRGYEGAPQLQRECQGALKTRGAQ